MNRLVGSVLARQVLEETMGLDASNFLLSEFVTGINIELEHSGTIKKFAKPGYDELAVAGSIALDHLREDSRYYSKLNKAGL